MKTTIELPANKSIEIEYDKNVYSPKMSAVDTIVLADQCIKETGAKSLIDVGCGSGVIGLSLKLLNPFCAVTLSDNSDYAVKQTRKNAKRLGLDVTVLNADLLPRIGEWPVVVCNLPSFDSEQMDEANFGPKGAYLASEDDGLALYRKLLPRIPRGGFLICEVQDRLQESFQQLCVEYKFMMVSRTDFSFALVRT